MTKKTSETKPGNQAESKQPTELKDEQLDRAQGGVLSGTDRSGNPLGTGRAIKKEEAAAFVGNWDTWGVRQ